MIHHRNDEQGWSFHSVSSAGRGATHASPSRVKASKSVTGRHAREGHADRGVNSHACLCLILVGELQLLALLDAVGGGALKDVLTDATRGGETVAGCAHRIDSR